MKTKYKIISIPLSIDSKFKYIARQPDGMWQAFEKPPCIFEDKESEEPVYYWWSDDGEIMDLGQGEQGGNWRETLKKI